MVYRKNMGQSAKFFLLAIFSVATILNVTVANCAPTDGKSKQKTISAEKATPETLKEETGEKNSNNLVDKKPITEVAEKDLLPQSATGSEPVESSDVEIAKLEAECMGVPQKSRFAIQNRQYLNQRLIDIAVNTWNCEASVSGKEATCNFKDGSAGEKTGDVADIEKTCKNKFNYYTHLKMASQNPESCVDSAMKFCIKTDFCPEIKACSCDLLAGFLCAVSKLNSPDECKKLPDIFPAFKYATEKDQKNAISLCEDELKGSSAEAFHGNDTRFINAIFFIGAFGGKPWPLLSNSVDLEELHIDPEFIWYYENVLLKKRKCGEPLAFSWEGLCKEYALTKSEKVLSKPGESSPPEQGGNKQ